jgi:hypothetical protein
VYILNKGIIFINALFTLHSEGGPPFIYSGAHVIRKKRSALLYLSLAINRYQLQPYQFESILGGVMIKKLFSLALILATYLVLFLAAPSPARAQNPDWGNIEILPESGHWNYPGFYRLRALDDATVSWEIKCTLGGGCDGREADFVFDYEFSEGDILLVGWGHQCYRWQFDPIDWPHGYIAEPEPECFEDTPTPTDPPAQDTPTSTPVTATPTVTGTIVTTPPTTPGIGTDTPTPTVTGTIITTPPATPGTGTPDTNGSPTPTPDGSPTPTPDGSPTPVPPAQAPAETPRSQIIAVTGADLSASGGLLPRIFLSLGIVFLGLGLVRLGISRKAKRN